MVVKLTEHMCQYCQLQMAARLTMRKQQRALTRERKRFSEICKLKTFGVQQRPHQ